MTSRTRSVLIRGLASDRVIRCSTSEQHDSGLGLEAQQRMIEAECDRRGWTLVRVEQDVASGGTLNGRPGFTERSRRIEAGEAAVLVAAKLDRVSRSVADFCGLLDRARKRGWSLVVLDVATDTTTPMGEAMANVAATFSQLERRRIAERTKEALAVRRSQGVRLGRPPAVPDDVRERARALRAEGVSLRGIASRLADDGVPTAHGGRLAPETIRRLLARS